MYKITKLILHIMVESLVLITIYKYVSIVEMSTIYSIVITVSALIVFILSFMASVIVIYGTIVTVGSVALITLGPKDMEIETLEFGCNCPTCLAKKKGHE